MTNEKQVTPGSGNVFEDLGFPNPQEHLTKARLVSHIATIIKERGLTQAAAGSMIGLDQPKVKVSALLNGQISRVFGVSPYGIHRSSWTRCRDRHDQISPSTNENCRDWAHCRPVLNCSVRNGCRDEK